MFEPPGSYFHFEDGSLLTKHLTLATTGGKLLDEAMDRLDLTGPELKTFRTLGAWVERLGQRAQDGLPAGYKVKQHASFAALATDVVDPAGTGVPADMRGYTRTEVVIFAASRLDDVLARLDQTNDELALLVSLGGLYGKLAFRAQVILALGHEKMG